jgi:hypothetical protein
MSPQAGYVLQEEVVPRLRGAIPHTVRCVGAEDPEELIQDGTAIAAKMLHNAEAAGKKVTPGNIAYYTIQHLKSGRRSTRSTVVDVLGTGTQLNGTARLTSFEEVAAMDVETGGEIFLFHDVLASDQEDPSMAVARKMDWETFFAGLSEPERALLSFVAEGGTFRHAAGQLHLSKLMIQTAKGHLASALLQFMGVDILSEVQRKPEWRNNICATRERCACREDRKT